MRKGLKGLKIRNGGKKMRDEFTEKATNVIILILIIGFIITVAVAGIIQDSTINKAKDLCAKANSEYVTYKATGTVFNANITYAECDYLNCDGKKICTKEAIVVKP